MKTVDARATARELDRRILAFIAWPAAAAAEFDQIALELFAYQYANNQPYRTACDRQGRTPANTSGWKEIPAISAASFSDARLACFPPECTRLRFVSSGTTRGGRRASVHELDATALYDASLEAQFRRCVMPDRERMPMVFLSPAFAWAPNSSLAYMCSRLFERCAAGGGFFLRGGELDVAGAAAALRSASEPALVFGTALAFVHFIEACIAGGDRFGLPAGSRLIETGGFKGSSRSVERERLYASMSETFGVPLEMCASEYGMCELGSQWYDANLSDALAGQPWRFGHKIGPHWTRVLVVDPVDARVVEDKSDGLLRVFDLANRGSAAAVLTGDLVRRQGDGFVYLGRSQAAPPKGCSLTDDSMLGSNA